MDVSATLGKRLGPLAAWQWGGVVGGIIVVYIWWRKKQQGTTLTTVQAADPSLDVGVPDGTGSSGAGNSGGTTQNPSVALTDNPAWIRYVEDHMVAKGYDPVEVHNALTKALGGLPLSAQERALYNIAVTLYGAPPEGAPPIDAPGTPAPGGGTPGTVGAVTGLKVTISGATATASWSPVAGAVWYHVFWRTKAGSTGGYQNMTTTATANLDNLNVQKGESIEAMVYASAADGSRGPDAAASAVR